MVLLFFLAFLLGIALFALAAYAVVGWVGGTNGQASGAPVRWDSLPVPVKTNPQWTSYTYTGRINALAQTDSLLWAGTDGGLVVWDTGAIRSNEALTDIPVARFMVEHGLPANRITSLAVGADGALWAGSPAGLGRYDGRAWQTFTEADGLPPGPIRDLAVDREGTVWIATAAGLSRYDGQSWDLLTTSDLLNPLPAGNPSSLAVDRENQVWMGTDQGLALFDGRRWALLTTIDGLSENEIVDVLAVDNGELWALTPGAANRLDGRGWTSFSWPVPPEADGEQLIAPVQTATIVDEQLVVGGPALPGGLQRLDAASGSWEPVELDSDASDGAGVTALLAGQRAGAFWAGTPNGLWHYDGEGWAALASPSDLPSADIADLFLTEDALWLATTAGVSRFDGQWRHYGPSAGLGGGVRVLDQAQDGTMWAATSDPLDGLSSLAPDQQIWSTRICEMSAPASTRIAASTLGPDGTIWFATDNGLSHYHDGAWDRYTMQDGLPHNVVTDLVIDASGTVWAGTPGGLGRFRDGTWTMASANPIAHLAVAPDGQVWAMTQNRLLRVHDDQVEVAPLLPGSATVRDMTANENGVWLATSDGVVRFDGEVMEIHTEASGLPSADVTALMSGPDGLVWAATSGNEQQVEISVFDGTRWRPHPFRDLSGEQLSNSVVLDVLGTPDGDVWLATPAGIERFSDGAWTAYSQQDGLPGRSVTDLVWAAGALWAGTDSGLARFSGSRWEPFGAASDDQRGPAIQTLASAPNGDLWLSLEQGWPNGLRVFNGAGWQTIDLLSDTSFLREVAFEPPSNRFPSGRAVALVDEAGSSYLGIFDGAMWTWHRGDGLPLNVEKIHMSPSGLLWVTGMLPSNGARGAVPGLAILDLSDDGQLQPLELFRLADEGGDELSAVTTTAGAVPVLFGEDGRVYVGVAGRVLAFDLDAGQPLQPDVILEPPLPFSRHTLALGQDSAGRLWVGTERGVAVSLNGNEPGDAETAWATYYARPVAPAWWGSVIALQPRSDGGVLLGTSAGGIGIYTGRDFDGVLRPSQGPAEWDRQFYPVTSVLADPTGQLWATSDGGGTASFSNGRWHTHAPADTLVAPSKALVVRGDEAWLGTERGLAIIAGLSDDSCRFANVEDGLATEMAMRDRDGAVWIGTVDDGLLQIADGSFVPETQWDGAPVPLMAEAVNGDMWFLNGHHTWLTWHSKGEWRRLPLDLQTVRPEAISALDVAPNLAVWIGSDQGVLVHNGRDWTAFTSADGLADNQVDALTIANDGSVWLATAGGLSHYTPSSASTP